MMKLFRTFFVLASMLTMAFTLSLNASADTTTYGESITLTNAIDLQEALPLADTDQPVLITATVGSICQVKGCWMGLVDEANNVRVTFKDYGFFVPPTLMGKTVRVQGTLQKVTLSLEDTKHYIEDAGGDPSTVTEPRVEYQIVATGVQLQ